MMAQRKAAGCSSAGIYATIGIGPETHPKGAAQSDMGTHVPIIFERLQERVIRRIASFSGIHTLTIAGSSRPTL